VVVLWVCSHNPQENKNQIQRTPITNRTMHNHISTSTSWRQPGPQPRTHAQAHRQPFNANLNVSHQSSRSIAASDRSDSVNEVEALIGSRPGRRASADGGTGNGWGAPRGQTVPRRESSSWLYSGLRLLITFSAFPQGFPKRSGTFKPAVMPS
jgi:hypothetical protein